jgi:hypothetical protein
MGFFFLFRHPVHAESETDTPSYPMRTQHNYPRVRQPEREADYSPPPSNEVKNAWSYNSSPPIGLHGVVLNQAVDTPSWRGT